jgi:transposase
MISLPDNLPDDPVLLKQMLLEAYEARLREQEVNEAYATQIVDL